MDIEYLFGCSLMGLGIGLDVVLATLSRLSSFNDEKSRKFWVYSVTATHTLFPMIGYFAFIKLYDISALLKPFLGAAAFTMIAFFLFDLAKSWKNFEETKTGVKRVNFAIVFSVSLDALWSGPAKSAQAINWSETQIYFSFFIVAFVVMSLTYTALYSGKYILSQSKITPLKHLFILSAIEFLIISYFGYLALFRYSFGIYPAYIAFIAALLTTFVATTMRRNNVVI